jgi:radical SAM protein with 4Fe4S-binding SPASM domain
MLALHGKQDSLMSHRQHLVDQKIDQLERFIKEKEQLRDTHPLRYLFWEATLRCNLQCLHCGSDCVCDNSTQADELEIDRIKQELQTIAHMYSPTSITFAIIGGEPLVRKEDVLDVGEYASHLGFHWGITTNGMFLDEGIICQLKEAGLQTISVSLDGLEPEHDTLRNCSGSYKKVIAGITCLVTDRFWRKFDVICCVSKINLSTLEEFIHTLRHLRVPAVRFAPVFSHGRASRHPELMLDDEDYRYLLHVIATARGREHDIDISLSEEGYWGPEWEGKMKQHFHYCASGILIGSILYNGDIIGCPSMSRDFIQGNLKDTSFIETWQQKFFVYRQGRKDLFANQCHNCEHWVLCEGGGLHLLQQQGVTKNQCSLRKIYGEETFTRSRDNR